jgi:hypothetical protein
VVLLLLSGVSLIAQERSVTPPSPAPSGTEASAESEPSDPKAVPIVWEFSMLLTGSGPPMHDAFMVVENGIIKALGPRAEIEIPEGAIRRVAHNGVVTPGFIHPASVHWLSGGRLNFGGTGNSADRTTSATLKPDKALLKRFVQAGFTTVAAVPSGGISGGSGSLLSLVEPGEENPDAKSLLAKERALLQMAFQPGTQSKAAFQKALTDARAYIKERDAFAAAAGKKKPEGEKKADEKPSENAGAKAPTESAPKQEEPKKEEAKKEEPKKEEPKKEEGQKEPKKDPKLMPIVDLLEGNLPGVLFLADAASFLHFQALFEAESSFRPAILMVPSGFRSPRDAWRVVEEIKALEVPVVLNVGIDSVPRTTTRRVTQRILMDAGIPVALIPSDVSVGNNVTAPQDADAFHMELLDLVRHGVSARDVLRSLTEVPAQILGISETHGTLSVGKRADFVLFSGEPFAPTTRLLKVASGGEIIYTAEELP